MLADLREKAKTGMTVHEIDTDNLEPSKVIKQVGLGQTPMFRAP